MTDYRQRLRDRGIPDGVPGRPALPRAYDRLCALLAAMGDAERLAFTQAAGLTRDPDMPPPLTDSDIEALIGAKDYRKPTCDEPDPGSTALKLWGRLTQSERAEFMAFGLLIAI